MERAQKIYQGITLEDVRDAAYRAFKDHDGEAIVLRFARKFDYNCERIYKSIKNHTYHQDLWYRQLTKINNNGITGKCICGYFKVAVVAQTCNVFISKLFSLIYETHSSNLSNCFSVYLSFIGFEK